MTDETQTPLETALSQAEIEFLEAEVPGMPVDEAEHDSQPPEKKAAMVITIESWATPLVGLLMLALGLLAGYVGRPLIAPQAAAPAPIVSTATSPSKAQGPTAPAQASVDTTPGSAQVQVPSATPPPAQADQRKALMDALVKQTRHFRGSEDAPVTIIEFSDFQ